MIHNPPVSPDSQPANPAVTASPCGVPQAGNPVRRPGVYVHLPFCNGKCLYCTFLTFPYGDLVPVYLKALRQEARQRKPFLEGLPPPDTLYFGGGTPSLVPADQLAALAKDLAQGLGLDQDSEISVEVNPENLSEPAPRIWHRAGINRVSLGVQTIHPETLALVRRPGGFTMVQRAVRRLRRAGLANLGLDLIIGLPGERIAHFRESLNRTIQLEPDHFSLYILEIEPGTGLEKRIASGEWAPAPEEEIAGFYLEAVQTLSCAGYRQYEISNFARPGMESRHNCKYWDLAACLGLGAGAHSFNGRSRSWNERRVSAYLQRIGDEGSAIAGEDGREEERLHEYAFLGLRRNAGISPQEYRMLFGKPWPPHWQQVLEKYIVQNLLIEDNGAFRLTPEGMLLSNEIFEELIYGYRSAQ